MFIGILSSPRKPSTLEATLKSVSSCGYSATVFAEPRTRVPEGQKTMYSTSRLGIIKNWKRLAEFGLASGESHIVSLEDDIDLHPETLDFVNSHKQYIQGALSLYASSHFKKPPGVHHIQTKYLWGSCALAFPREVVEQILTHPTFLSWKRDSGLDLLLGSVLHSLSLPVHIIFPSPVRHTSTVSTMAHGDNTGKRNCSRQARHTMSLEKQIWPN